MSKAGQSKAASQKPSAKSASKPKSNLMKYVPWVVVGVVLLAVAFFALKPAAGGTTV